MEDFKLNLFTGLLCGEACVELKEHWSYIQEGLWDGQVGSLGNSLVIFSQIDILYSSV